MLPDAGIAGPVASANAASATPSGERKTTWCERHHGPAYGRDALREIQREISEPDSSKSGKRLPKGAAVLSFCQEGRRCETSILKYGSFSPACSKSSNVTTYVAAPV